MRTLRAVAALMLAAWAASAHADERRYPASGTPAATIEAPGAWVVSPQATGISTASPNGVINVLLAVGPATGTLEEMAHEVHRALPNAMPLSQISSADVSGLPAAQFEALLHGPGMPPYTVKLLFARISETQTANVTMVVRTDATPEEISLSKSIIGSLKVITK